MNLDIKADGTFAWSLEGCDTSGGDCGKWRAHPDGGIVLESANASFRWVGRYSMAEVKSLRVTREGEGISVRGDSPSQDFPQTWKTGALCVQCDGSGPGPSGLVSCNEPVENACTATEMPGGPEAYVAAYCACADMQCMSALNKKYNKTPLREEHAKQTAKCFGDLATKLAKDAPTSRPSASSQEKR